MWLPALTLFSLAGLVGTFAFAFLDVWYLLFCAYMWVFWRHAAAQTKVLDESVWHSWVLPADLDSLMHMNNARYAREADFGRYVYMFRCGLMQAIWNGKHGTMLTASSWRFRRALKLWEPFAIRTRMLGWDDHSFYMEQQFISSRSGFVCAVVLAQHYVTGTSPSEVMQSLYGRKMESPELPEDVHHWLKSIQINRERVKNESKNNSKSE